MNALREELLGLLQQFQVRDGVSAESGATLARQLVQLAQRCDPSSAEALLQDAEVLALRGEVQRFCALGESAVELTWAQKVLDAQQPAEALKLFPYHSNYVKLTRLEYHNLTALSERPPQRVLFLGAGPFPISALLLAQQFHVHVDCVDISARAVELGNLLAARLGISNCQCRRADASTFRFPPHYDAVFLAALVGLTRQEKVDILNGLVPQLPAHARLVLRSARGLRKLLYPEVDFEALPNLQPLLEVHPHRDVVNSIIIAAPRSASA